MGAPWAGLRAGDRRGRPDALPSAKGLKVDELLTEIETIVESGTRVDINYYTQDLLDEYQEEELDEFFRESEELINLTNISIGNLTKLTFLLSFSLA